MTSEIILKEYKWYNKETRAFGDFFLHNAIISKQNVLIKYSLSSVNFMQYHEVKGVRCYSVCKLNKKHNGFLF